MGAYIASANNFYLNEQKSIAAAINFWYQFPEIIYVGKASGYYKLDVGIKATTANKKWDIALNVNDLFRSSAMKYSYTVNGIQQTFTNFQLLRYLQLSVSYRLGRVSGVAKSGKAGNEDEKGRLF